MSDRTDWSLLPEDISEAIFGILTLLELARISRTCRSFHALYCQRMAAKQQSQCNVALESFGLGRINLIAGLIYDFLKRGSQGPAFIYRGSFWVCPEGIRHTVDTPKLNFGRTYVSVYCGENHWSYHYVIKVQTPKGSLVYVRCHWGRRSAVIQICPTCDEDLEEVALVQALRSGGLAEFIRDSGRRVEINICLPDPAKFTVAGIKDQMGPLMPFSSRYTGVDRRGGGFNRFEPRIYIERVGFAGKWVLAPIRKVGTCVIRGTGRTVNAVSRVVWGVRDVWDYITWAI
jgi:hypothetical protein